MTAAAALAVSVPPEVLDPFKDSVRAHYDALAGVRDRWYRRNSQYHGFIEQRLREIIGEGRSVLELGTGTGNLLAALRPEVGVGLDLSPEMVKVARSNHRKLAFEVADAEAFEINRRFDWVVASDLVGELGDITSMLEVVRPALEDGGRIAFTFHNPALEAAMRAAQRAGLALAPSRQNWLNVNVLRQLLDLSDYDIELEETALPVPVRIPGIGPVANRHLSGLPGLRYLNLVNVVVARPRPMRSDPKPLTCSVIVPCRNEVGNIEAAVTRTPRMGAHTEIIFVDGASTDGTKERIEEMIARYRGTHDIKLVLQVPDATYAGAADDPDKPTLMLGLGKGDAVRKGFDAAKGDVLMILDADLTVPPEDLPRFFSAIASGKAQFVNGTRLVYPMEERAMKFVNYLGNKFFSVVFTWLLEQPIRDTLCGTKVLLKDDYERIKAGRAHFGEFDPFGDFDLLFGAARLRFKIVEVPVRYRRRMAGVSKVRVSRHGWLLVAMSMIAFRKLKLARWLGRGQP